MVANIGGSVDIILAQVLCQGNAKIALNLKET
jgi:hypothetical protein